MLREKQRRKKYYSINLALVGTDALLVSLLIFLELAALAAMYGVTLLSSLSYSNATQASRSGGPKRPPYCIKTSILLI
jgi:hypothetical protein